VNLLDTSIIVEMLKKKSFNPGIISPITLIEVLRGIEAKKRVRVKRLLEESFTLLNLDNRIIEAYCVLYDELKKGNLIPDADILIAATALACNLLLETKDEHFQRLKPLGLKLS
jgi:tRNA(fMet)-specific endonuclease VapC